MKKSVIKVKTVILPNATKEFKTKVARLLNSCMKDYNIKGTNKDFEDAFKKTFKSNLYYEIDNYFNVKKKRVSKKAVSKKRKK